MDFAMAIFSDPDSGPGYSREGECRAGKNPVKNQDI